MTTSLRSLFSLLIKLTFMVKRRCKRNDQDNKETQESDQQPRHNLLDKDKTHPSNTAALTPSKKKQERIITELSTFNR
jgi:hypothetical protein